MEESNLFFENTNNLMKQYDIHSLFSKYDTTHEESFTIVKLIDDFKNNCKDLKPINIQNIICNEKVFTGFRCMTCEIISSDGSSNIII